jgi:hypothetical protein
MEQSMDSERNPIESQLAALEAVQAPASLRHAVTDAVRDARRAPARRRFALPPRPLTLAGGSLAALAVGLVLLLGGGAGSAPSVAQAAQLGLRPATAPAPASRAGGRVLAASVEGIAYPTWSHVSWRAVGARSDTLDGRRIHTVFYADASGARVGYSIAEGDALPVRGGRVVERSGVAIRVLRLDGATAVTWQRGGHTCILAGRGVDPARLVRLASYST